MSAAPDVRTEPMARAVKSDGALHPDTERLIDYGRALFGELSRGGPVASIELIVRRPGLAPRGYVIIDERKSAKLQREV